MESSTTAAKSVTTSATTVPTTTSTSFTTAKTIHTATTVGSSSSTGPISTTTAASPNTPIVPAVTTAISTPTSNVATTTVNAAGTASARPTSATAQPTSVSVVAATTIISATNTMETITTTAIKPATQPASTTVATTKQITMTQTSATTTPTTKPTTTAAELKCSSQNLTNTVVYYGSQTSFARVNNAQPVMWQYSPSSDPVCDLYDITTDFGGPVVPPFDSAYSVDQSGLKILSATYAPGGSMTYSTAGLYILNYVNPTCTTAANLIVIQTGPTCACDGTDPKNVKFTCSVTYAESSIQPSLPILTWTDSNGVQVAQSSPTPTQIDPYLQTSEVQYLTSDPVSPTYQCQLNFAAPSQFPLDYMSTVAPTFMASCSVANCATTTTPTYTASEISTTKVPSTIAYLTTTATFSTTTATPPIFSTTYPITTTASFATTTQPTTTSTYATTTTTNPITTPTKPSTAAYSTSTIAGTTATIKPTTAASIPTTPTIILTSTSTEVNTATTKAAAPSTATTINPNPTSQFSTTATKSETSIIPSSLTTIGSKVAFTTVAESTSATNSTVTTPISSIAATSSNIASTQPSATTEEPTVTIETTASSTTTITTPPTTVSMAVSTTAFVYNCTGQNLTNTVVYEGTLNTTFPRLNNGQAVQWQVIQSSDIYNSLKSITNYDDNVTSQFVPAYAVNGSGLMVFNATVASQGSMSYSTAGIYVVKYRNPNCSYAANLIVIRSGPVCSCNASDPNNVKLSCSVDYAESNSQPNNPVFTWKNSSSVAKQQQPLSTSINSYLRRSTSQLLLSSNDSTTYECQLTFADAPKSPFNYLTITAPNFTASCYISNCAGMTTVITTTANPITTSPSTTTATNTTLTTPPTTVSTAVSTTAIGYNCTGQNLTNTVVYEGTMNTTFPRLNNGQAVQWQIIQSSDVYNSPKSITNYDDNVTSQFIPAYAVNGSGLVIFNATVAPQGSMTYSTAGVYVVKYRNPNCSYAANLIVIRSGPTCTCDASNPDNVTLSCSVDFAESNLQPSKPVFTWKNDTSVGEPQQLAFTPIGSYLKRSKSQLSITSNNDPSTYECQLTFGSPPISPLGYFTTTAPNFTASCHISDCVAPSTVTTLPSAGATAVPLTCVGQNLTNTVVYEGNSTSFQRVNNGQAVQWQVISSSNFVNEYQAITNYDDVVDSQFSSTYAVTQSQLTIFNATVEPQGSMPYATAGLYTLTYRDPNCTTAANLIVIRSGPTCSCSVNDPNTTVTLSCSVDFAGVNSQPNYPILSWNNKTSVVQQDQPNPSQMTSYLQESTFQLQISSNDPTLYTCRLTFSPSAPADLNYVATNAPNFTASCNVTSCGIPQNQQTQPHAVAAKAVSDSEASTVVAESDDDAAAAGEATKIVLGLFLACILNTIIVFGFWFFCCCAHPLGASELMQQRRMIRRKCCLGKND